MTTDMQMEKIERVCVRIRDGWREYDKTSAIRMPFGPDEYYREVAFDLASLVRFDLDPTQAVRLLQKLLPKIEQGCMRRAENLQDKLSATSKTQEPFY